MRPTDGEKDSELLGDDIGDTLDPTQHHSDEPIVLAVPADDAIACESSRTTLADGTPCAIWRLPDIIVNTDALEVTYKGRVYPLTNAEQTVLLLKGIVDAKGEFITAQQIAERHPVFDAAHTDRAMRKLPDNLRDQIEATRGKGYRLRRLT